MLNNCINIASMNSIQLDDRNMDERFLNGDIVICDTVLPAGKHMEAKLQPGCRIVVQLSNRKKFMAEIKNFSFAMEGSYIVGKLELIRTGLKN